MGSWRYCEPDTWPHAGTLARPNPFLPRAVVQNRHMNASTDLAREGLRRVAMDLHVHTPASHDWVGDKPQPAEFVQAATDAGLAAIAITDHQTGEWIDQVKEAAATTDLTVFPGVEINNLAGKQGIHLVALFDVDASSKDIDRFLAAIKAVGGVGKDRHRKTAEVGIIEVLNEIRRYKGIAVLAHCQSSKGALGEMRGDVRTQLVQHPVVLAAEATAADFFDEAKKAKHSRVYDLLDGSDPTYRRKLAVFQSSDNPAKAGHGHSIEGIGSRWTYFYVEEPISLESLRQCFIDREVRIAYPPLSETKPAPEVRVGFPQIVNVAVTGGFLDGLDLPVHAGLNTLIGSKGSGKSLLIELIRFALDQPPTQPAILEDHDTKLGKQLGNYGKVELRLRDAAGTEHVITRTYDPANGNPYADPELHPSDLFACHLLSQGEIVRLAESEDEQIRFIDSFFDFRSHQRLINETKEQIEGLDSQVGQQIRARKGAGSLAGEIKTLDQRIEAIDKQLKDPVFAAFRAAQKKASTTKSLIAVYEELAEIVGNAVEQLDVVDIPSVPEELAEDPLARRLADLATKQSQSLNQVFEGAQREIRTAREKAEADRGSWLPDFEEMERKYREAVASAGGDVANLSQERARLAKRREEANRKLRAARLQAERLTPTVEKRAELLSKLEALEAAYSAERKNRCELFFKKSDGQIRASVSTGSNVAAFRTKLEALKRGSYLSDADIEKIAASVRPEEFVRRLLRYELTQKPTDLKPIATTTGIDLGAVKKLAEFLLESYSHEELLALQYRVTPTDRPAIEFRLEDGTYAPLAELSTGQKSTAFLVMTLCEGTAPIIVDQPEDSLDLRSIWEDMCLRLRSSKTSRQFVFTTHNSSLAVASDTDKFVVLAGDGRRGRAVLSGAIDSERMRDDVIKLLEGGAETYFLKQAKYNLREPRPVTEETEALEDESSPSAD